MIAKKKKKAPAKKKKSAGKKMVTPSTFKNKQVLVLDKSGNKGCRPNQGKQGAASWKPDAGSVVMIVNDSKNPQKLTAIDPDILISILPEFPLPDDPNNVPGDPQYKMIDLDKGGYWVGRVSSEKKKKEYKYNDEDTNGIALKKGTIDPG